MYKRYVTAADLSSGEQKEEEGVSRTLGEKVLCYVNLFSSYLFVVLLVFLLFLGWLLFKHGTTAHIKHPVKSFTVLYLVYLLH